MAEQFDMQRKIVYERCEDGVAVFEVLPNAAEKEAAIEIPNIECSETEVPAEYSTGDIIDAVVQRNSDKSMLIVQFIGIDHDAMRKAKERNSGRRARLRERIANNK